MNCQEALNLLYDVIDKEASQIDVAEVQKHLDHCQDCLKKFQVEESLQAIVKERLKAASDIPKIDQLKSKVLAKLEEIDSTLRSSSRKSLPFKLPAVALAIAASGVLLLGAAYWGKGLYDHYTEYIPIERAHWSAADNIDAFADSNNTQLAMAELNKQGFTILDTINGLSLVGGRMEEMKDFQVPHFLYSNGLLSISLFAFPKDAMELADDLLETRITIDGNCYLDHNCRGCRLVYHSERESMFITATVDHSFDLLSFNPAVGAI
ncbi:MAG TPA: zf-HC2 domain-containing protein [candidate division Zixibacteria bacterium]|nr:zf-HC2 domain-containing protein [candidate division Zixibacteria bacterium]